MFLHLHLLLDGSHPTGRLGRHGTAQTHDLHPTALDKGTFSTGLASRAAGRVFLVMNFVGTAMFEQRDELWCAHRRILLAQWMDLLERVVLLHKAFHSFDG